MKLAVCCIMTMSAVQCCHASDSESERKTLTGLTAIHVLIETLPQATASLGLTKESLATDVARKLRQGGMRVAKDLAESPTFLYVNVAVTSDSRAANVFVELNQPVRLVRDPTVGPFSAITWSQGTMIANPSPLGIRNTITNMVDEFLNAWLSVNPRPSLPHE